jgi:hypothetical protein
MPENISSQGVQKLLGGVIVLFFLQFSHSREEAEQMMAMKDRTLPL